MNFRKITCLLFLSFTCCLSAFSQTDSISVNTIVAKTVKYNNEYPFEKVYLHFDKPYYAVGDTIWFKAYLTNDVTINDDMTKNKHLPSAISKVVYVDILSSKDSIVQSLKLPVTDGTAVGDIMLNNLYKEGNYHIKAYTNWMRNFDPAYFFNKTIPVGSIVNKSVFSNISFASQVNNNTAKIAATIHYYTNTGRDYAGKKVSWKIQNELDETLGKGKGTTDSKGNIVIDFATNKTAGLNTAMLVTGIDITNNSTITNSFSLKNLASPIDVQFFPEGGELINGIKSKVAFKAIKPDGLGLAVQGSVTDNTGAVVATITTQHLGMGVFELTPTAGKTYKAALTFADGSQNTYDLPKAKDDGLTIAINNTDPEKISLTFYASDPFFQANKNKPISILAQSGQVVCYAGQSSLPTKSYTATISKSKFPTGIAQFTIFASNGQILAERVVFIQRNDQLKIGLSTAKTVYTARDQVAFNVTAKTPANKPALANLSVTVLDETKVPFDENAETTILTNILLTSDLKGYIEKPNYYFTNINDKTIANLDVLMLTQGYRRIVYKDVFANKPPAIKFSPENGIEISGTLRTNVGMPIANGTVNFYIKNMRVSASATTNREGEFKFSKLFFPDSVKGVVNARGSLNANYLMIILNSVAPQSALPNTNIGDEVLNIDTTLSAFLQNNKAQSLNSHVIKEVVIKEQRVKRASHQDYPMLAGLSNIPDHVVDGAHLAGFTSLYDCLKSLVPGVTFNEEKLYLTRDFNGGNTKEIAIYYNGAAVDLITLRGISPETVDQIELFSKDGLSGLNNMNNTNGVLVISSKKEVKPPLNKELLNELLTAQYSAVKFNPKGYYMARAFYSPKYDVTKNGSFGGDLRTTIYWNPKLVTDKNGVATFDFFNADGKGTYKAIIEGIDNEGNIGRTIYRYKVQ